MTSGRAERRTTDMPAQRVARTGIDLSGVAQRHATVLRLAYLGCIAIATLLQLGFDPAPVNVLWRLHRAIDPPAAFKDLVDAARNVALFLGWGATWVLTSPAPTTRRDVLVATLLGTAASLTVESLQLFSQFRTASIFDVATNTLGSLLGALTLWLVERRATSDMREGTLIGVPSWLPGGAMLMSGLSLAFTPSSRATTAINWASSPFERARGVEASAAIDVSWHALSVDAVVWVAVGVLVAAAISDRTGRVRWSQLFAWTLIVPTLLWATHEGRAMAGLQRESITWMVQGAAVVAGLMAGFVALPLWRNVVAARSSRALQVAALVAGVGALMSWTPAWWVMSSAGATTFSWRQLVPMMSLFQRQDLSSVFLVLQKAGIGAAVGACLAARKRVGEPRPGVRGALLYAAILEVGQFFVPGRYPDITDVLITGAAAGLVAVLVARADRSARQIERREIDGLERLPPSR
jgi:VanZ family protein